MPLRGAEAWGGGGWGQTARHEQSGGVVPSRIEAAAVGDGLVPSRIEAAAVGDGLVPSRIEAAAEVPG